MTVINHTTVSLEILGEEVKPQGFFAVDENAFSTVHVHSEIGSGIINTDYEWQNFRTFGGIEICELPRKDKNGKRIVVVLEA